PLNQRPLELGVDFVIHSATKFLSGHSNIIAGLTVTADDKLGQELYFSQNSFGNILVVQDSFTLLQNIKTKDVRFSRSAESAQKIATFLTTNPLVE
ncbi:PLP-dependent transferase, partial [Lysinibacillus fusiformis]|uniref:PLP-dependent transferase n=1 Tax=Lysinibacillus fusiformis TaxID=28031 RepID=UPI00201C3EA9